MPCIRVAGQAILGGRAARSPLKGYAASVVALRVTRRHAFAAAAGWAAGWRCDVEPEQAGRDSGYAAPLPAPGRVIILYRDLARFVLDPDLNRQRALRRALGERQSALLAGHGADLDDYLLDQTAGLGPADAAWAAAADAVDLPGQVREGLARSRAVLAAGYAPDVFLILSRRFDGRTDGRSIYFGVNRFGETGLRERVRLLTAHEYNHIVRAGVASFDTLLDAIVAEGLATVCSELVDPGRPAWEYLLYTPEQYAWFTPERRARLWTELTHDAESTDPARRFAFLEGGCPGPHGAPPRAGYYLGREIVRAWLQQGASIAALTRMSTARLWAGSGYAQGRFIVS